MKTLNSLVVRNSMAAFRVEKSLRIGGDECRLASVNFSIPSTNGDVNGDTTAETFSYRTPMYMIHTQSGTIPHVTPEVLDLIYPTASGNAVDASCVPPIQISVDSTVKFIEPLQKFGKGIGKFVGLPDVPTFLTVHDSLQMLKPGHNDKFGIAMWSRHGRAALTPERFVQALGCFKPSLCQILSDYDVSAESSGMKRLKKSLARAEEYTSFVAEEKGKLNLAHSPGLFITVEAAWFEMDEELAKKTVANLLESQHRVEGIVIAGLVDRFVKPGPIVNDKEGRRVGEASKVRTPIDMKLDLVDRIVKIIPPSLPRYVPGPFSLSQMVSLISKGIDILDSSVVSKMADHGEVFILDEVEAIMVSLSLSSVLRHTTDNETLPQRGDESKDNDQCSTVKENSVISIKEKRFFDDFRPLTNSCMCYTCRKHTRSYVHHLYATDELLGPVLVQIHNLTALDRLFHIIRGIIRDSDNPESLSEKFTKLQQLLENPLTEVENLENPKMLNVESAKVTQ